MYELKGFAHIGALVDNTRTKVAPVGELAPNNFTYAREKEYYNSAGAPGHTLIVFSSKLNGTPAQTDPVLAGKLLDINKWVYTEASAGSFTSNPESFRTRFITQFGDLYSLYATGTMVKSSANVYVPGNIEIRDVVDDTIKYRIWYANESFEQQFDEFEIKVVGPIDELDAFFQGAVTVQNALNARTQDVTFEQVQAAREGYPETYVRSEPFEWYDPTQPTNPAARKATFWNLVIYGIAGNNIDAIKEAIREYILGKSTHTKEEWAVIFPEIFTATEFVVVPLWGQPSITNRLIETGLYSPLINYKVGQAQLKRMVRGEGYTDEWLAEHGEHFPTTHKQVGCSVIGGPKNRDGVVELYQRYPDYICVRSTDDDFRRMGPETRRFVAALEELLIVAEAMTPDSSIPVKYSRLVRDGVLFLVQTVDKFQYLIVSKFSYMDANLGKPSDGGEPQLP